MEDQINYNKLFGLKDTETKKSDPKLEFKIEKLQEKIDEQQSKTIKTDRECDLINQIDKLTLENVDLKNQIIKLEKENKKLFNRLRSKK